MKLKHPINSKQWFEIVFISLAIILFIIKTLFPSNAQSGVKAENQQAIAPFDETSQSVAAVQDSLAPEISLSSRTLRQRYILNPELREGSTPKAHRIIGVNNYNNDFSDINDLQLVFARRHGIEPQYTRKELDSTARSKMIYVGSSPYYHVDKLRMSIPYLTPRASMLLNKIGRNFMDSLFLKQLPQSQLIVTSFTRSIEDVANLQSINGNATQNSCHFYGTTFDISYNRYHPITRADGSQIRQVRDDTLKRVLGEVLYDLRKAGACYVKHERKQGCFHITVK